MKNGRKRRKPGRWERGGAKALSVSEIRNEYHKKRMRNSRIFVKYKKSCIYKNCESPPHFPPHFRVCGYCGGGCCCGCLRHTRTSIFKFLTHKCAQLFRIWFYILRERSFPLSLPPLLSVSTKKNLLFS